MLVVKLKTDVNASSLKDIYKLWYQFSLIVSTSSLKYVLADYQGAHKVADSTAANVCQVHLCLTGGSPSGETAVRKSQMYDEKVSLSLVNYEHKIWKPIPMG